MRETKMFIEMREQLSRNNYELLHKQLLLLNWRQRLAIELRFWEQLSIFQVAYAMGIGWEDANKLIDTAIKNLKTGLVRSLTKTPALKAA